MQTACAKLPLQVKIKANVCFMAMFSWAAAMAGVRGGSELGCVERVEALRVCNAWSSPRIPLVQSPHPSLAPSTPFLCRDDVETTSSPQSLFRPFFSPRGFKKFSLFLGHQPPKVPVAEALRSGRALLLDGARLAKERNRAVGELTTPCRGAEDSAGQA